MAYLERLLNDAGYAAFRDARHPLGLTQRQSSGKFTRQEASELIDRLAGAESDTSPDVVPDEAPAVRAAPRTARQKRDDDLAELLRGVSDELLAAEVSRRGWTVTKT